MKGLEAGRQPGQSCILVACGAGRRKGKLRALSRILSLGPSIPHYDFLDFPLLVGSGIPPPPQPVSSSLWAHAFWAGSQLLLLPLPSRHKA